MTLLPSFLLLAAAVFSANVPDVSSFCGAFLKASIMLLVAGVGPKPVLRVADMSSMITGAV